MLRGGVLRVAALPDEPPTRRAVPLILRDRLELAPAATAAASAQGHLLEAAAALAGDAAGGAKSLVSMRWVEPARATRTSLHRARLETARPIRGNRFLSGNMGRETFRTGVKRPAPLKQSAPKRPAMRVCTARITPRTPRAPTAHRRTLGTGRVVLDERGEHWTHRTPSTWPMPCRVIVVPSP